MQRRWRQVSGGTTTSPKAAVVWCGAVVTMIASSCTSLPDIQHGACGNGVVEPERNEDCDDGLSDDAGHTTCYPAGTSAACHFDCSTTACPDTFSCGTDNVCRKPKGIFKQTGQPTQVDATRLFSGDFNHDGFGDVVAQSAVEMNVLFGDTSSALTLPFTIRQPNANPAVGLLALDPDGSASEPNTDLVFSATNGVTTWRGRNDRTLAPTAYPSIVIGNQEPRVFELRAISITDDVLIFTPVSALVSGKQGSVIASITAADSLSSSSAFAFFANKVPSDLAGNIAIGAFSDGNASPCDEFILAFKGDANVDVFTTCQSPTALNVFDVSKGGVIAPIAPTGVTLLGGTVREDGAGIHSGDVNGDGHLDFIVDAVDPSAPADAGTSGKDITLVAYGLGNGHFSSRSDLALADDVARPLTLPLSNFTGPILAIGQLTAPGDTSFDFVTADQIVLQIGGGGDAGAASSVALTATDQPLANATIVDIDEDGAPDVVAGSTGRVDIYRGTTTFILTHALFAVDGNPDQFSFGDFDGDRAIDLAFRASHATEANQSPTADLDVMWGKLLSVPEDPAVVARFGDMLTVGAALISGPLGNSDAVGDIGVVVRTPGETTADASYSISVLAGSTSRQLQAPFFIQKTEHDGPPLPGGSGPTDQRHSGVPLAFAVGQLTANDRHADLVSAAALEVNPNKNDPTLAMRLVIAPSKAAASLDNAALLYTDVFNTFNAFSAQTTLPKATARLLPVADWSRISLTTVDLDGSSATGTDEIIGIAPALLTAGAFFTAKQVGTDWQISPLTSVGALPPIGQDRAAVAQVGSADLDGDGNDDVLVLSDTGDSTKLVAYINDKSGQLPTSSATISLPSYASGVTETPFHIVAFAAIDADAQRGKEVALLTDKGGLFLAKSNATGTAFTVTGPLCNGDELATCVNNPRTRIPSGQAITAADVDGDGVQDLVIESSLTLQVFKGIAVDP